jgi:hypothetical protein|tara:strand:- start:296 stop:1000 length:705 start_codon:yes stop_codon:yes gene_type:complete
MTTVIPTKEVIELAYAAYRVNKGYEKLTRRHSESPPTFANKELIALTITSTYNPDQFVPEDFTPLVVTEADREAVETGTKHMRRYTLLAMGDLPQFESDLFAAYSSNEIPIGRIGLLAYLPAFVDREVEAKVYKQRMKTEFADSAYIGLANDKLEPSEVEILKIIPLTNYDFGEPAYLHFGAIGKDLVCFTKKEKFSIGQTYQIVGKIKGHDVERETKKPLTRLNYVKMRKREI